MLLCAGDELGDPRSLMEAAGAVGCSVLGCSQQLGRAARAALSFREEVWTLDGAPEHIAMLSAKALAGHTSCSRDGVV